MVKDTVILVKAFMDDLAEEAGHGIIDEILRQMPPYHGDDVYTFEIVIRNVKDITQYVGVNEEGARNFSGVDVITVKEEV